MNNFDKIRNFGFIAHIDAGKTTTTERVLFVTGANYKIGEVDEGTTTTDWMEEEKERGITITAAAVSAKWKDHIYHIIDTPGHVDFTAEVQRSLRVLDGVVVVLCGVAGVQTQTETVWKQADNFNVPRIVFVNKLDRIGAKFENAVKDISEKFNSLPVLINIPYYENDILCGIIDLVNMKKIEFNDNSTLKSEGDIPESYKDKAFIYRESLIDILTQFDDKLLELVLEEKITEEDIRSSLRTGTIKRNFIPVLCGASFKNIGIPPLLDAINMYLPSPNDISTIKGFLIKEDKWEDLSFDSPNPVLYIFKVQYHREKGPLAFTRIYSGNIKLGDNFYNPRTKKRERIQDLLKVFGNDFERIGSSEAGDIVIIVGTKDTVTGDTLCSEGKQVMLERLSFPEPVIHIRIEPKNSIDLEKFNIAKTHLILEDPTINCKEDADTGQTLVGGMGELHIEIFLERIKKEYGVDLKSGNPQVVYRETPQKPAKYTYEFDKKISGNVQHAVITLSVEPVERNKGNSIEFAFKSKLNAEENMHVENGIKSAFLSGPESAYPVVDCKVTIEEINYDRSRSTPLALEACANICTGYALREAKTSLLEPVMKIEIDLPDNFTGTVIGDLQSRNGVVLDIVKKVSEDKILAKAPLKQMFGYTTSLRSLTQGKGSFSMQFLQIRYLMMTNKIVKVLSPFQIDFIGVADISPYESELERFGGNIVGGYTRGISIGIKLPDPIVDGLKDRYDKNVSSLYFTHSYHYINDRLNLATSVLSSYLNSKSYNTLPIPSSERTGIDNAIPTVSHKMIAHLAGLGWIGKSCLLITPDNGPRVRFSSLLTNAPLKPSNKIITERCKDCTVCTDICPANAIKGKSYISGEEREMRFDFKKCQDYFDQMKKDDSRKPVCGMCLYSCPYGMKKKGTL